MRGRGIGGLFQDSATLFKLTFKFVLFALLIHDSLELYKPMERRIVQVGCALRP